MKPGAPQQVLPTAVMSTNDPTNTTVRAYQASLEMFFRRTFESMLQEKDMRKRENAKLRLHCEEAVKELHALTSLRAASHSKSREVLEDVSTRLPPLSSDVEKGVWLLQNPILLRPLIGACECRNSPKITVIALDCLQKLIAYGHVNDTMLYVPDGAPTPSEAQLPSTRGVQRLIEFLVDLICQAFQSDNTDEGVMLQIVKALLTVMTSSVVHIHDKYVMNVFRTCYSIFMGSRNPVNQLTAKATLTQILRQIFQRMETVSMEEAIEEARKLSQEKELHLEDGNAISEANGDSEGQDSAAAAATILQQILASVESEIDREEDARQDSHPFSKPIEAASQPFALTPQASEPQVPQKYSQVVQKDAFHVFRSICYLSMKTLPEGTQMDPKSHYYRSKILSLELLLSILQEPGPVFKENEIFIRAIRQYLCIALPKNGACSSTEVFELTVLIFLSLLTHFKQYLKPQIEVFFKEIFLYILETPSSSFEHKLLVTEALGRICSDAQCVFDLYINYDCCMTSANIFEKLVNVLAKVAHLRQSGQMTNSNTTDLLTSNTLTPERNRLKLRGLECLVYILKCMVEWSRDLYYVPEQQVILPATPAEATSSGSSSNGLGPSPSASMLRKKDSSLIGNSFHTSSSLSSFHVAKSESPNSVLGAVVVDDPEQYETLKQRKEFLERDIQLFNKKPLHGLKALQSHGFVGESVDEVAAFLMQEDSRIDLSVVGDFLGDANEFNRRVMNAYVDRLDFTGLDLVAALRLFLAGFRLPGEAQKIDRLMEKFASRYMECNPDNSILTTADTAYVLAYSIIMLTTSLHSAQLKKHNRMSKEEYLRMGKGINNAGDIPEEYLASIYDEIASCELKMKDTASAAASSRLMRSHAVSVGGSSNNSEKQRRQLFDMEMESMSRAAKALMESLSHHPLSSDFTTASHVEHVRPMFKIAWTPFLAAFSVGLQDCDDEEITRLCLEGIRCAIRIACLFRLHLERDAYVQALAHFTMLTSSSGVLDIRSKHVECIKTLISVAYTDANYLAQSWLEVLRCFSQLESAHLIGQQQDVTGSGGGVQHSASSSARGSLHTSTEGNDNSNTTHSHFLRVSLEQQQKKLAIIQEVMGETGSHSLVVAVDKIFASSSKLDGDAIVHFVQALCQVSREELASSPPRIFSLQKLVEISYYNMGRVRLQWSRTWSYIGQHFYAAGCSHNPDVAFFAVDSLRQLAVKFIEKGEFANFHFQKDFLRPFVNVLEDCRNPRIEDMVVTCVQQLVASNWFNIRSGWSNIFTVFSLVAPLPNEAIVKLAFQTCSFVVNDLMKTHLAIVVDSFRNLVHALAQFACNQHYPDISMDAIRLIRNCAKHVHEQTHVFLLHRDHNLSSTITPLPNNTDSPLSPGFVATANTSFGLEEDRVWVKGWLPILCELFKVIHSCKLDVRTRGLTVLFDIIKTYGGVFTERWWRETFYIVFHVFAPLKGRGSTSSAVTLERESEEVEEDRLPQPLPKINMMTSSSSVLQELHRFGGPVHADRAEWLTTTCNHTLYAVVDVFTQYFDSLGNFLLDELCQQLYWCCQQEHEQLARSGTSCLETLVLSNGKRFTTAMWQKVLHLFQDLFTHSTPHALMTWRPPANSPPMPLSPSPEPAALRARSSPMHSAFAQILVHCVVQHELIRTVDNILFYPATSRKEDEANLKLANILATRSLHSQMTATGKGDWLLEEVESCRALVVDENAPRTEAANYSDADSHHDGVLESSSVSHECAPKGGMFDLLSIEQLLLLARTLMESYRFAKSFNMNHEQRNLLWRAGFKGKAKPNLLNQETHSLSCALRIYFRLLQYSQAPEAILNEVNEDLSRSCDQALHFYSELSTESHPDAWNTVIILLLTRLLTLQPTSRARQHLNALFGHLCDLCQVNRAVPLPVRSLLSRCIMRCGYLNTTEISPC